MTQIKLFLLLFVLLLATGCHRVEFGTFSIKESVDTRNRLDSIADLQNDYKALNDKYKRIEPTIYNGLTYETHEYITPDGKLGYQVLIFRDAELIKSIGYGIEAENRTYEITPKVIKATTTDENTK